MPAWHYPGHVGDTSAAAARGIAAALEPLELEGGEPWDPADAWPVDPDEPVPEWLRPILAAGPRPEYEFAPVPGGDELQERVFDAAERGERGDREGARRLLRSVLAADQRMLAAHAQLGWMAHEHSSKRALAHYQLGVAIGERALPPGFAGSLPWGLIENRPFLGCLHGLGIGHLGKGRREEAAAIFESLLWLNPTDNQGAAELLDVAHGRLPRMEDDLDR